MEREPTCLARQARPGAGPHVFHLPAIAGALRTEPAYQKHGRNGVTLLKKPGLRTLVEVLRAGSRLAEHRAPGPITVHVLEGEIRFQAGRESFLLGAGELLALDAGGLHAVEAVRDACFLITLAPLEPQEPQA